MSLLKTINLSIRFGGLKALESLSMEINEGEIVGLIGPNGAGKTTVFNLLTGVYQPTAGSITLDGHTLAGYRPDQIVDRGMARTFQNIRLFKRMTVIDNIKTGFHHTGKYKLGSALLRLPAFWREEGGYDRRARELLGVFNMEELAGQLADSLPYGQQRKLEICRALASDPKILLLDEPAAGMNPTETEELMRIIRRIRDRFGITILLIEHDMHLVMGICERIVVLNYGRKLAEGRPAEISNDERVINAYLGGGDEAFIEEMAQLSEKPENGARDWARGRAVELNLQLRYETRRRPRFPLITARDLDEDMGFWASIWARMRAKNNNGGGRDSAADYEKGSAIRIEAADGGEIVYVNAEQESPDVSGSEMTLPLRDAKDAMLLVDDLHVYYGSIHAIKGVSFAVYPGEIVTLIGANGAGKTTVLQTISGLLRPRQGRICFMGKEIHKVPPASILHMGLAQVPEGRRIFTQLTVEENLALGAYSRSDRASIAADMDKFYRHFPILKERRKQMAGTLSGGEQQMLAIARALMSRPDLLLLDEPSMGLSPLLVQEIFRAINNVRSEGTTILLVEQNARMALCIADRAYVLETGRVAISGSAAQLLGDDKVRRAYLGIVD